MFDPPIENNVSFKVINIRKNVTVFPDWVFEFDDAINSVPFSIKGRTIDTGCAWIADIELGEENTDGAVPYCEARIEIHIRKRRQRTAKEISEGVTPPSPWQTEQLNEGLNQIIEDPDNPGDYIKVRTKVKDDTGADIDSSSPMNLDADGKQITTTTPATIDDDTIFIVFRDHEELDFNALSFLWTY